MRYCDPQKQWTKKIIPHLGNKKLNDILVRDFNKFTFGRWKEPFTYGQYPHDFESCDWWCDHRGKIPRYWKYVKHAACHWLVNFTYTLAELAEPQESWRIITSDKHSTVWDGNQTLFDFNFQASGITPQECFDLAFEKELPRGKLLRVYFADHYSKEPMSKEHRETFDRYHAAIGESARVP